MKTASSSRENDGARSTTGPENPPDAAISIATFAPKLNPTTTSHPSLTASFEASRA